VHTPGPCPSQVTTPLESAVIFLVKPASHLTTILLMFFRVAATLHLNGESQRPGEQHMIVTITIYPSTWTLNCSARSEFHSLIMHLRGLQAYVVGTCA